ncbi:hypothetical protein [Prevotella sp. HUN102]|uniref:hypothetical protein n=1 Tax=Prevotella sp. HUN102 TaxID=1392486 RepID=UPI000AEC36C7|nr:hypothetical protein [Prevotella sp. HUN102]
MTQIVVEFYARKKSLWGEERLERKIVKTGKSTIEEAYDVAVANGHNPNKNIRWWSEPM